MQFPRESAGLFFLGRIAAFRRFADSLPAQFLPFVVTAVGLQLGYLLSGAVLTERIFNWPGLGTYAVQAVLARDFPALQGTVLFLAVLFVGVNLVVDLSYGVLDPRLRDAR